MDPTPSATITADEVVRTFQSGRMAEVRPVLARFVLCHQHAIRAIARQRLSATTRSVCDSDELLATVLRRLDSLVEQGSFTPSTSDDVWALVNTVALNTAISKIRLTERARAMVKDDGAHASMLLERFNRCPDDESASALVTRLMLVIPSETDRQIFSLRLRGTTHHVTAQLLGLPVLTVRKRWSHTMAFLQACVKEWEDQSW